MAACEPGRLVCGPGESGVFGAGADCGFYYGRAFWEAVGWDSLADVGGGRSQRLSHVSKHASWGPVWLLLPPTLVGMVLGFYILDWLPEEWAKPVIGSMILLMVVLQLGRRMAPVLFNRIAHSRGFGLGAGSFAGFATMVANAAGPVFQLYLLSKKVPKMELIGIGARFFLLVNLLKLPCMGGLNFTTPESLLLNLKLIPLILIGVFFGKHLLQLISQRIFEWMVVGFAVLAGFRLILV